MCSALIIIYANTKNPYEKQEFLDCFRQIVKYAIDCGERHHESTLSSLVGMKGSLANIKIVKNTISEKIHDTFIVDLDLVS
jgi:hypothetical protein